MHLLESIITCPKPLMFLIDNVVDSMVYLFVDFYFQYINELPLYLFILVTLAFNINNSTYYFCNN